MTIETAGTRTYLLVGGTPGALAHILVQGRRVEVEIWLYVQPVNLFGMCEREDKLIDDTVDADGAADDFHRPVWRVLEYEVVTVEECQLVATNPARYLRNDSAWRSYRSDI